MPCSCFGLLAINIRRSGEIQVVYPGVEYAGSETACRLHVRSSLTSVRRALDLGSPPWRRVATRPHIAPAVAIDG